MIALRTIMKTSGGITIVPSITLPGTSPACGGSLCPGGIGNIYRNFSKKVMKAEAIEVGKNPQIVNTAVEVVPKLKFLEVPLCSGLQFAL
jgi:hypothetical protein